jgi:ABC-2 type transport system ATP-binding protein
MVGVTKRFGDVDVLRGVHLEVPAGRIVALLGLNGAGKSTLVRTAATTVLPDEGTVHVGGWSVHTDAEQARTQTGLVLNEDRSFYWRLSGRQNLEFFSALHALGRADARRRVQEAIEAVDMGGFADRRVDRYSSGMRARLGLARALLGRPRVLLLDEPTRSLDPVSSIAIREMVLRLANERMAAVLFVTHDLHEAAQVASKVAFLVGGRIVREVSGETDAEALERTFIDINEVHS